MPARLALTIILCFVIVLLRAQTSPAEKEKPSYQILGAFSLPLQSFADETEGGAQNGWGLCLQEFMGVGAKNIFISYSLSYTRQPYKFKYALTGNGEEFTGHYSIVNLLLGFGTRSRETSTSFYVNFMGGFTYASIGGDLSSNYGINDALTFGISPGVGIALEKNFSVGLKYYYASPTFKSRGYHSNHQQKISMLHLVAGIEF